MSAKKLLPGTEKQKNSDQPLYFSPSANLPHAGAAVFETFFDGAMEKLLFDPGQSLLSSSQSFFNTSKSCTATVATQQQWQGACTLPRSALSPGIKHPAALQYG